MATFPKTVVASTTANTLPADTSLQNATIDPGQIYVGVYAPGTLVRPDPGNSGSWSSVTYYRLSDLINYIVATAKGQ